MANGQSQRGPSVLEMLLSIPEMEKKVREKARPGLEASTELLKALFTTPTGKGMGTDIAKKALGPYQKGVEKALKLLGENQVNEAVQQGVPPQHIEQQAGLSPEQQVPESGIQAPEQPQSPQSTQPEFQRQGNFLSRPMQVNQGTGEVHPAEMLGGLIQAHPATTQRMLENLILGQSIVGQVPAQKGELQKLEAEYGMKAVMEAQKQATDPNSPVIKASIFQNDLLDLVQSFEAIPIKGRGKGGLGAVAAGILQIGKKERAEYNSKSEAFVYSFASYIAQQQGRALDKEEVKRFRDIIKLKTGETRGSIKGKIQAMVDLANTRSRAQGLPELPNVSELLKAIKGTGKEGSETATGGVTQSGNKFRRAE